MGALKGGGTIGYRYLMSLHMGLGRGPVNELVEIRVGDITAWDQAACLNDGGALIQINKPDLFGGDEKEGGIKGPAYILHGGADQELPPATTTSVGKLPSIHDSLAAAGGDVPNFRGVVSVWFDGMVCALNPYPKEWAFRVRRTTAGWADDTPWYPAKATIYMGDQGHIKAMNGAHMLYELASNPDWGRGLPRELIDGSSYTTAANQLCAEGFGLCIPWYRQETVGDFTKIVIDHIGAAQYVDRETGKLTLKLIRADYDPADLPLFTPDSGLISIEDDDAGSQDQLYNEIIVQGFDPIKKEDFSVRAQNLASIQSLGVIISNTIQYKGIPTRDMAARVAVRELKLQTNLRRLTVNLDRRGWKIAPAGLFRISHPKRGIANLVLRAGEITETDGINGNISIKAVQDVFGLPATSYYTPQEPGWSPPDFTALPVPEAQRRLIELTYRDAYVRLGAANVATLSPESSFVAMLAERPTGLAAASTYDLTDTAAPPDYAVVSTYNGFGARGHLETTIQPLDTTMTLTAEGLIAFEAEFLPNMLALIDDEIIQITAFDDVTREATIVRGTLDSIPARHVAGAFCWLLDDPGDDTTEYVSGETVDAYPLTRTSTDLLDLAEAEADGDPSEVTVRGRVARPYPPADVKADGVSIFSARGEEPEPVLTWVGRDRLTQADAIVGHTDPEVGPEAGVTYTVRVYDFGTPTLLREETGIVGDTWTYDATMQGADGSPNHVDIELVSVRDDLESYFAYRFPVTLSGGYGLGYGLNYGGA